MVEVYEFASEWDLYKMSKPVIKEKYIRDEVFRLIEEKKPVLTAILMALGKEEAQTIALKILRNKQMPSSSDYVDGLPASFKLRLAKGVKLPPTDCNGRPTKDGEFAVKVGITGDIKRQDPSIPGLSPRDRKILEAEKRLYTTAVVTSEPREFDMERAVTILRANGVGVAQKAKRSSRDSQAIKVWDSWLVEEVV